MTTLQPKPVHLAGTISHGDWMNDSAFTIPRRADPPAAGGLTHHELPSLWQLLTDTTEDAAITTPLTRLLDQMEDSPAFRRGQVAGAIADLQEGLEQVSHQADGDDRLSLPVGTVVILAHVLLRHMP